MLLSPALQGSALAPDELARRVQAKYEQVRDFTADFEHTYEGGVLRQKVTERGRVQVKKPGKMRWTYTAPETEGVRVRRAEALQLRARGQAGDRQHRAAGRRGQQPRALPRRQGQRAPRLQGIRRRRCPTWAPASRRSSWCRQAAGGVRLASCWSSIAPASRSGVSSTADAQGGTSTLRLHEHEGECRVARQDVRLYNPARSGCDHRWQRTTLNVRPARRRDARRAPACF